MSQLQNVFLKKDKFNFKIMSSFRSFMPKLSHYSSGFDEIRPQYF